MNIKKCLKKLISKPLFSRSKMIYNSLKIDFDELKELITFIMRYNQKIIVNIWFWHDRDWENLYSFGEFDENIAKIFLNDDVFKYYIITKHNLNESFDKINLYKKYSYVEFPQETDNELYDVDIFFRNFNIYFNPHYRIMCVYFSPGIINSLPFVSTSFLYKKFSLENFKKELDPEFVRKYVKPYSEHKEELFKLIRKYGENKT